MKVRVCYTVEVTDEYRRALNSRYGRPGMATRKELQEHFRSSGSSEDDDIISDYLNEQKDK